MIPRVLDGVSPIIPRTASMLWLSTGSFGRNAARSAMYAFIARPSQSCARVEGLDQRGVTLVEPFVPEARRHDRVREGVVIEVADGDPGRHGGMERGPRERGQHRQEGKVDPPLRYVAL